MYLNGFGNYHQSEAVTGALPLTQNSPQQCALGLYAEQLSGTSFTRARHLNLHSWLYRTLPSVAQGKYSLYEQQIIQPFSEEQEPNPLRWSPLTTDGTACDFINGLFHLAGTPSVNAYLYHCTQSMDNRYFANNDGEMLFVPYEGEINLFTEFGILNLQPGMIAVIPRGVKFKIELMGTAAKGYIAENSGTPLALPALGPLGANGLAHPRHFEYPVAAYEQHSLLDATIITKYQHKLWVTHCDHSPLNVVAWHGNYTPYRYDLSLFNTVNTVSFDHPDPSIFTVLTSESEIPGVANLDFVIFPPRWMVAEHTFRPPYFHRNYMNELMGLIRGQYDAKKEGFAPGGVSIHNYMVPHGPDFASYQAAVIKELKPEFVDSLAFMFETKDVWQVTHMARASASVQADYVACWQGFKNQFQLK